MTTETKTAVSTTPEESTVTTEEAQTVKYTVETVDKETIGEKISNAFDSGKAFVRRHWKKFAVVAMGIATAVALPIVLEKVHEDDIPFVEDETPAALPEPTEEVATEEPVEELEPAAEE